MNDVQNVPPGYKQTEVGVIPEDWEVRPLSEGISLYSGQHILAQHCNTQGKGTPYITGPADFPNGVIEHTKFTDKPRVLCSSGDILITVKGSGVGTTTLANHVYCISRQLMAIRPESWNSDYLYSFLKSSSAQLGIGATGLIPGLSRTDISELLVPVPPLPEQEAIASALRDVDDLLDSQRALLAKKRDLKTAALDELLSPKRRLPGFSGEWEEKTLGRLADIQRGASPRPIDSPIWFDSTSKVGWVRISDVSESDGKNLRSTRDYLSEKGILNSRFLPEGSLIMSICATIGLPAITRLETCIHDGFVGFTNLKGCDQEFLYYKLKELEPLFKSKGQTGSQSNINSSLVRECEIQLPPILAEQQAIAQVLGDMDDEIAALEEEHRKTRSLKSAMMDELLTGRTRLR